MFARVRVCKGMRVRVCARVCVSVCVCVCACVRGRCLCVCLCNIRCDSLHFHVRECLHHQNKGIMATVPVTETFQNLLLRLCPYFTCSSLELRMLSVLAQSQLNIARFIELMSPNISVV